MLEAVLLAVQPNYCDDADTSIWLCLLIIKIQGRLWGSLLFPQALSSGLDTSQGRQSSLARINSAGLDS